MTGRMKQTAQLAQAGIEPKGDWGVGESTGSMWKESPKATGESRYSGGLRVCSVWYLCDY